MDWSERIVGKTLDARAGVRETTDARIEGRTRTEQMKTREEGRGIGMARIDGGVGPHVHIIATTIERKDNLGRHGGHEAQNTVASSTGDTPQPATVILWTNSSVLNRRRP